jgi:hypothetical protein
MDFQGDIQMEEEGEHSGLILPNMLTFLDSTFKAALDTLKNGLDDALNNYYSREDPRFQQTLFEMSLFYQGDLVMTQTQECATAHTSRRRRQSMELEETFMVQHDASETLPSSGMERRILGLKRRRVDSTLPSIGL